MLETTQTPEDAGLDWLFAQARRYPLLTAAEEGAIDAAKWRAISDLQTQLVAEATCRVFLLQLAWDLLEHPPAPREMPAEQYQLLKRETAHFLSAGGDNTALVNLCARLALAPDRRADRAALDAVDLPAALTAGLAEIMAGEAPGGVAAALLAYRELRRPQEPPPRPGAAQRDGLRALLHGYYAKRACLVNHNLRLVFSLANRLGGRNLPFRDLVQEGVVGLLRAAEKYRSATGNRFSTYAFAWINQSMRRALADQEGIVRLPAHVIEQVGRLYRERSRHLDATGREPRLHALADRLNMDIEDVAALRQLGTLGLSTDSPREGDDDGLALGETLSGGPFSPVSEVAQQASLRSGLLASIARLKPAERDVVVSRWGLNHQNRPLTRAEIADQRAISSERVRQLETSALAKLRADPAIARLVDDLPDGDHALSQ